MVRSGLCYKISLIFSLSPVFDTTSPGVRAASGDRAGARHGNLTPPRISPSCPHCVVPVSLRAVAGQEYHCLPAGSSRFKLPNSKAGNGMRTLTVFVGRRLMEVYSTDRSWRISGTAVPSSGTRWLTYPYCRLCYFQGTRA